MDLTSEGLIEAKGMEEKRLAKAKNPRGMSLRACVAKTMMWMLEKANALPSQEASINKASWP